MGKGADKKQRSRRKKEGELVNERIDFKLKKSEKIKLKEYSKTNKKSIRKIVLEALEEDGNVCKKL